MTTRRRFLRTLSSTAIASSIASARAAGGEMDLKAAAALFESLTAEQRRVICFDWDHRCDIQYGRKPLTIPDPKGILLRSHISNAWRITPPALGGDFYTQAQRDLVLDVLGATMSKGWVAKLVTQAEDDLGLPWGGDQSVAFFGQPGRAQFQCVITGFHLTVRAAAAGASAAAFGGPVSHGHQPSGFYEKVGHPGNFFWYQAQEAARVYHGLDSAQRKRALLLGDVPRFEANGQVDRAVIRDGVPLDGIRREADIRFRPDKSARLGIPVGELSSAQQEAVRTVVRSLIDPYQPALQQQVLDCLQKQGGIAALHLAYYQVLDMGDDDVLDNWRLEGPSFAWWFRGAPHAHIYIHVAGDSAAPFSSYFG